MLQLLLLLPGLQYSHCSGDIIGERAKRARHSQVYSIKNRNIYVYSTYVIFAL